MTSKSLPEHTDSRKRALPVARAGAAGAPGSVQSQGTTASTANPLTNPADAEWASDLEHVWRTRMAPVALQLRDRARACKRRGDRAGELHAKQRARAISMSRADVVGACRGRFRTIGCGCGRRDVPVGCDQPQLCTWCARRHWWRWRKRITRALRTHVRAARAAWSQHRRGMPPGLYLVTLTMPHSGDIAADRVAMGEAWRLLSKRARASKWWGAYAATYEVTADPTRGDGLGHVHLHIAAVSSWIPYDELHAAWRCAMPGALVIDVQAPRRDANGAGAAANYLAKYVTKGVQPTDMSGQKAGEMLVGFRGRRKVTTSAHFWQDPGCCLVCRRRFYLAAAPPGMLRHAPAAVIRAVSRATRAPPATQKLLSASTTTPLARSQACVGERRALKRRKRGGGALAPWVGLDVEGERVQSGSGLELQLGAT